MADYDLTIAGTRFPQLALGTLLAKRGKRVLIVDALSAGEIAEDQSIEGYRFRRRPVPMSGLDSGGLLRVVLDEIGIGRVLVNEVYPVNNVSYQVVLPRHRLSVYPERERLFAELAREFPQSIDVMRELYGEWDTVADAWFTSQADLDELEKSWLQTRGAFKRLSGLFHARRMAERIRTFEADSPQSQYLSLQHHFLGAFPPTAEIPLLAGSLIHSIGRRGTYQETTGTGGLTALILQRFREYGGELADSARISGFEPGSRDHISLLLTDGRKIHTRTFCTSAGIAATIEGLRQKKQPMPARRQVSNHPVRFYLAIEDRIVPQGMEDNVFLAREDDGGPLGLKHLYLALSPRGSDMAPEGKRSLTVTALAAPDAILGLPGETVEAAIGDLLRALEAVIPFLMDGLVSAASDLDPVDTYRVPRALPAGIAGWSPGIVGRMSVAGQLRGRVALINPTPWELGIEGETLAALAASGVIKKSLGLEA